MNLQSVAKSIGMMKAILAGATYDEVAKASGLTRSAVEQRIKNLARNLQTIVGVEGIDEDAVPTVSTMRDRKDDYLEALEHYQPEHAQNRRNKPSAVTEVELDLVVEKTRQMSNCKHRDVALLLALFSTAAKPLEIARMEVRDYLNQDGSVREESVMRSDVAVNGEARPLFFSSAKAVTAIDAYLVERVRRRQGVQKQNRYRGLDPASKLFLTDDGNPMPIKIKEKGHQRHHLCGVILDIYRKIFAHAGLKGVSALSARRTVAKKLQERGADKSEIGKMLGLKERNSVCNLLPKQSQPLKAAAKELV